MTVRPHGPPPHNRPSPPSAKAPEGACDTHIHMLAAPDEFPLWDSRVEDPAPGPRFDDWLALYRAHLDTLGMTRGVIVQSIFYGTNNDITIKTLRRMGPGFKGICLVTDQVTDAELDHLAENNIAGLRLNYVHGGVLSWDGVRAMAPRLADRGLHIQMLMNTHKHMAKIAADVAALPVPVCFDHIGWPDLSAGPSEPGFQTLCNLLSEGKAWVKLSGIYRLCKAPYTDADAHVAALVAANPKRCLWGSDWPHIMLADAQMPDAGSLLDAFYRAVPDPNLQKRILINNPARLYRF